MSFLLLTMLHWLQEIRIGDLNKQRYPMLRVSKQTGFSWLIATKPNSNLKCPIEQRVEQKNSGVINKQWGLAILNTSNFVKILVQNLYLYYRRRLVAGILEEPGE